MAELGAALTPGALQEARHHPQGALRFEAVVRGMVDHRSNAFVEAMNGLLQQAKRASQGLRTSRNFIAIAYMRMYKLKHLPASPFALAAPR